MKGGSGVKRSMYSLFMFYIPCFRILKKMEPGDDKRDEIRDRVKEGERKRQEKNI